MSDDRMPKFNPAEVKGNKNVVDYMKIVEAQNLYRVNNLKRIRRNNLITALGLGGIVIGVFSYTVLSVKQETFLDDFEEPKKIEPQL